MRGREDYCTCFPDKLFRIYFGYCCKRHDKDYRLQRGKINSDVALAWCVACSGPWYMFPIMVFVGLIMLIGVQTFGWLFYWYAAIKKWWRRKCDRSE